MSRRARAYAAPRGRRHLHREHGARRAGSASAAHLRRARRERGRRRAGARRWTSRDARASRSWASRRIAAPGWCAAPASGPQARARGGAAREPRFADIARARRASSTWATCSPFRSCLHDDMLSEAQIARRARRSTAAARRRAAGRRRSRSPSASSSGCCTLNPALRIFVLGGDHSVAWPVVAALARRTARAVGDRAPGRTHGSAARAPGRAVLLRHLGLSRQRAARPRRAARAGRHPRVGPRRASTGRSTLGVGSSGPTRCARAAAR